MLTSELCKSSVYIADLEILNKNINFNILT